MFKSALLLLTLLCGQDIAWSVKILELRVPAQSQEGGEAILSCHYDLEGVELYSVKWYKDKDEFYKYLPKNSPMVKYFKRPGVTVNMHRSSNMNQSSVVVLENLSNESEGEYACEVSGEAPSFPTKTSSKYIRIYLIPESGPYLTGAKEQYYLDEQAVINCSSSASNPLAQLEWLVNDQPPSPEDLQQDWQTPSMEHPYASERTLQLRFTVAPRHFVDGVMRLKCQATIAPLYQHETNSTHYIGLPFTITQRTSEISAIPGHATNLKRSKGIFYIITMMLITLMFIC